MNSWPDTLRFLSGNQEVFRHVDAYRSGSSQAELDSMLSGVKDVAMVEVFDAHSVTCIGDSLRVVVSATCPL